MSQRALAASLAAALVAWSLVCLTLLVSDSWYHYIDCAVYVLTSRGLAAGEGYVYLGEPFLLRPPGLAWLIRPWVAGPDWGALNLAMQASAVAASGAVALACTRLHRPAAALSIGLLFALSPLCVGLHGWLLSEFPFTALFFVAVWLLLPARAERHTPWPRLLLGALVLGASGWLRTQALLLLPALLLAALLRPGSSRAGAPPARARQLGQAAVVSLIVLLCVSPWLLHVRRARATLSLPVTQVQALDYTTAMLRSDPHDPRSPLLDAAAWSARLASNGQRLVDSLALGIAGLAPRSEARRELTPAKLGLAALALLAALAALWRRRTCLDVYLLLSLAVFVAYLAFASRVLVPVLPLLLSALLFGAAELGRRWGRPGWFVAAAVGLLLAASLLRLPEELEFDEARQQRFAQERVVAAWIREHTRADDLLLHERAAVLSVLSDRTVYSTRNLPGPWPASAPEVDWIVIGPRQAAHEPAVQARALERRLIPLEGAPDVRAYRMR